MTMAMLWSFGQNSPEKDVLNLDLEQNVTE